jgi:hypothetical protein
VALAALIANAANQPDVKEGLWSVHTQSVTSPGNKKSDSTYTLCRSHAWDRSAQAKAKSTPGCSMLSESFQRGEYSSEMRCVVARTVVQSKLTSIFQGETSYHSEVHATYTPPTAGISEMHVVMDQEYVGSCPAGAQPGDGTDAQGRVIHLGK